MNKMNTVISSANEHVPNDDAVHVLIVDDDERIRELLAGYLRKNGYRVSVAEDASAADHKIAGIKFDLMILDVMMPGGENGMEFSARIRKEGNDVPILMLTALSETKDRIKGLETGIDDYLSKPFEPRELVLRIQNILKRREPEGVATNEVKLGSMIFYMDRGLLKQDDENIKLTDREQDMLRLFGANPGRTITRQELAAQGAGSERAVDVQINRLRQKIETDPGNPVYLQTIRGKGYILHQD